MYRAGRRQKSLRRRVTFWSIVTLCSIALIVFGITQALKLLKPTASVKQTAAVVKQVTYDVKTKLYTEPDFTISLPQTWTLLPRPVGPYTSFTWQSPDRQTDGQLIEIYEDVIPVNFAVNRVMIVEGGTDQLTLKGNASDNCANFTGSGTPVKTGGVHGKWQGIDFICDTNNQQRDVIGTSSTDGVNTVVLKSSTGVPHKFFFTYTDFATNPDYTVFYNALQSLRLQ